MKLMTNLIGLILALSSTGLRAEQNLVDLFPMAVPDATGTYLKISIKNDFDDVIFCKSLEIDTSYSDGSTTVENPVVVENLLIKPKSSLNIEAGRSLAELIRVDFPNSKIVNVEKASETCVELGFASLKRFLDANGTYVTSFLPTGYMVSAQVKMPNDSIELMISDIRMEQGTTIEAVTIHADGSFFRKVLSSSQPIQSNDGTLHSVGSDEARNFYSQLHKNLSYAAKSDVREILINILQSLSVARNSASF